MNFRDHPGARPTRRRNPPLRGLCRFPFLAPGHHAAFLAGHFPPLGIYPPISAKATIVPFSAFSVLAKKTLEQLPNVVSRCPPLRPWQAMENLQKNLDIAAGAVV